MYVNMYVNILCIGPKWLTVVIVHCIYLVRDWDLFICRIQFSFDNYCQKRISFSLHDPSKLVFRTNV